MRKYRLVAKKGEGTFSEVLKAQNVKDGRYHAIKCMKNRFESIDQVNNLREIQALRRLSPHDNIITLEEVLYDQPTGRLALVFELMDANLYELIRGRRHYLNPALIKSYMWQLMKSLDHMHRKGIFHRDIKPENILIENTTELGRGLKLADFGSCRGIYSKQPYTEYISTRWYRAPECLLTDGYYGPEMDMWGAGCVFFEITSLYPLFPGSNEVDQISRIHKVLSTPTPEIIQKLKSKGASHISFDFPPQKGIGIPQLVPHAAPDAVDLMVKLIKYDASERISARETLRHPYFREVRDQEQRRGSVSENKVADGDAPAPKPVKAAKSESFASSNVVSSTLTSNDMSYDAAGKNKNLPDIGSKPVPGDQPGSLFGNPSKSSANNGLTLQATSALPPIAQTLPSAVGAGKVLNNPAVIKTGGSNVSQQQQLQQQLQQQSAASQAAAAAQKKRKKPKAGGAVVVAGQEKAQPLAMAGTAGTQPVESKQFVSAKNGGFVPAEPKTIAPVGVQGRKSTKF